jgi:hypothetical protein
MFSRGPVPAIVHGLLDYVVAGILIAGAFVLSFEEDAPTILALLAGLGVLLLTAFTAWTTGIVKSIPVVAHAMIDYLLGIFLVIAPFLFGFNDDDTASAFFVLLGVALLLLTVATRFASEPSKGRRSRRESRAA